MGLFDAFKKQPKVVEKPKPKTLDIHIVTTDNVPDTISKIAKEYGIKSSQVDFDILSIETDVKLDEESEFVPADEETFVLVEQKNLLEDENFRIKQVYELRIKPYASNPDLKLIGGLKIDKSLTYAYYIVSANSTITYSDNLKEELFEFFKKRKLRLGALVDIPQFEKRYKEDVEKLVAKIQILGKLEEDVEIELCKGVTPIKPVEFSLNEKYKENKSDQEYIYPIKNEELLIEIIKPKMGKHGRSCNGGFIKIAPPKDVQIPEFKIKDDVKKEEDTSTIKYISKKNGYIKLEDGAIIINDELEVNKISVKTGNISGAEDSDIKISIKDGGALTEAIQDGMVVETTEIIAQGNVGNNAKVKAVILEIGGQTHKNSKLIAKEAKINSHKGHLKANEAHIQRLEGGKVEARVVHIKQAISGEVIADEVIIDTLMSHVVIKAHKLIEINILKGGENKLIIDEGLVDNKKEQVTELEFEIKQLGFKLRQIQKKIDANKTSYLKAKAGIAEINEKIKDLESKGEFVSPVFTQQIKRFEDFKQKTIALQEEFDEIEQTRQTLQDELSKIQGDSEVAKIISHSGFHEFNRIEFKLINPSMDFSYDTKEIDLNRNIFQLKECKDCDEGYRIVGEVE